MVTAEDDAEGQVVAREDVVVGAAPSAALDDGAGGNPAPVPSSADSPGGSVSERLFERVREQALFRTPDYEPFASFEVDGHRETWPVDGTTFKSWLIKTAHEEYDAKLPAPKVNDLIALIRSHGLLGGEVHDVHVRVGACDGMIYLDLCNEEWEAVEITPDGWSVVSEPPIRFRRDRSALALSPPVEGGTLDELRGFVNVSEDGWMLICSWLVAALRPVGPYPVLDLVGEQGSAKSTTARMLRALVDPNKAPLRSEPRSAQDLMIAATNARVIALDNLSKIRDWLSDALCRLATGGGFATRKLYTNAEEVVLDAQRPVILTGIGDHSTRSDLLDRELLITLNPISEEQRLPEATLWAQFEKARPWILGALLDVVAHALGNYESVELEGHPRMADFAQWAAAAAPAFGWTPEAVLEAYERNRLDLNALALDDSPLTKAVREVAAEGFHGPAADLLAKLAKEDEDASKRPGWPKTPRHLSAQLNRLAPNFRTEEIEITTGRETTGEKNRYIDISRRRASAESDRQSRFGHARTALEQRTSWCDTALSEGPGDVGDVGDAASDSVATATPPEQVLPATAAAADDDPNETEILGSGEGFRLRMNQFLAARTAVEETGEDPPRPAATDSAPLLVAGGDPTHG